MAALGLAPLLEHLSELVRWVKAHPAAPSVAQCQLAGALKRLQREDQEVDQLGLDVAA